MCNNRMKHTFQQLYFFKILVVLYCLFIGYLTNSHCTSFSYVIQTTSSAAIPTGSSCQNNKIIQPTIFPKPQQHKLLFRLYNNYQYRTTIPQHLLTTRGGQQEDPVITTNSIDHHQGTETIIQEPDQSQVAATSSESEGVLQRQQTSSLVVVSVWHSYQTIVWTMITSIGQYYSKSLIHSPILTKSITAGIIFTLSDVLAQCIEKKQLNKKQQPNKQQQRQQDQETKQPLLLLEWKRIVASLLVGLCYFGPAAHYWYEWIFTVLPSSSFTSTIQKAALGQLLFGPAFICIFILSSLIQSNTLTLSNYIQKIKTDLPGAVLAGMGYWPIVDMISYSLISPQYIPLFVNICSLIWTTYLAVRTYSSKNK